MATEADLDRKNGRTTSPLDRLLDNAPPDDELDLDDDDDLTRLSREQAARGETIPHAQVRRELLGA